MIVIYSYRIVIVKTSKGSIHFYLIGRMNSNQMRTHDHVMEHTLMCDDCHMSLVTLVCPSFRPPFVVKRRCFCSHGPTVRNSQHRKRIHRRQSLETPKNLHQPTLFARQSIATFSTVSDKTGDFHHQDQVGQTYFCPSRIQHQIYRRGGNFSR